MVRPARRKTTGWLREEELIPKTNGYVAAIKELKFGASRSRGTGKVRPLPIPQHDAKDVNEARESPQGRPRAGPRRRARGRPGRACSREARPRRSGRGPAGDRARARGEAHRGEPPDEAGRVLQGCLASLSAKELDTSTQALAPSSVSSSIELESVTCCGAGDIHEAEPDYYLHLNARILAYAEATGAETLMTICNVCTLNLRQANWQLKIDDALAARVNTNLEAVGVPPLQRRGRGEAPALAPGRRRGLRAAQGSAHKGLKGLKIAPFYGCQILRPSKLLGFEDPDRAVVARADHRGLRRRGRRLSGEDQVLRLPDHPGT